MIFTYLYFQTVAVLGAHSLGRTTLEHAGFNGVWTPKEETTMYVTYYQNMIAKNLTYKNVVSKILS